MFFELMFFVEPKMVLYGNAVKLSTFIFKSVQYYLLHYVTS